MVKKKENHIIKQKQLINHVEIMAIVLSVKKIDCIKMRKESYCIQMSKDREKEINYLLYIKSELIKQTKKEIKTLQQEKDMLNGYKRLERSKKKKI